MSAGMAAVKGEPKPTDKLDLLAPKFRAAVEAAIAEAKKAGLDPKVIETFRSAELQALYYQRGRTIIPPNKPVTNAQSSLFSWHGYGLAIDVISLKKKWGDAQFFHDLAPYLRATGCRWGGEWKTVDLPHFQWGLCKPSPSDRARELFALGGREAVWEVVGAL